MGQFASSNVGMGNNPISGTDPTTNNTLIMIRGGANQAQLIRK